MEPGYGWGWSGVFDVRCVVNTSEACLDARTDKSKKDIWKGGVWVGGWVGGDEIQTNSRIFLVSYGNNGRSLPHSSYEHLQVCVRFPPYRHDKNVIAIVRNKCTSLGIDGTICTIRWLPLRRNCSFGKHQLDITVWNMGLISVLIAAGYLTSIILWWVRE